MTFHGITRVLFGYCEDHRCCARCGWWVYDCTCQEGVLERDDYVVWKRAQIQEQKRLLDEQARALRTPPRGLPTLGPYCTTCGRTWDDPASNVCSNAFHLGPQR